ncbi:hypothetical protein PCH_Pc20g03410 [Penicillium rubens Wisconsin 54-1255]|uniref:Uncharacterized protein n=1 Tax=Penicillium rubens (strain ATCC 28089 / DSM 1075 / NRRL 1951 / Wisconsin 54-1255) TaxID=500485 RepID=B6HG28_PENRW|nr:hypothetical protein PCH_Pc20g03410 [Penicillium rubens Wisconsin 54-1255]
MTYFSKCQNSLQYKQSAAAFPARAWVATTSSSLPLCLRHAGRPCGSVDLGLNCAFSSIKAPASSVCLTNVCTTDNAINVKEANAHGPGAIVLQAACEDLPPSLDAHAALTIATCVVAVNFLSGSFSTTAALIRWSRTAENNRIAHLFLVPTFPSRLIRRGSGLVHRTGGRMLEVFNDVEKQASPISIDGRRSVFELALGGTRRWPDPSRALRRRTLRATVFLSSPFTTLGRIDELQGFSHGSGQLVRETHSTWWGDPFSVVITGDRRREWCARAVQGARWIYPGWVRIVTTRALSWSLGRLQLVECRSSLAWPAASAHWSQPSKIESPKLARMRISVSAAPMQRMSPISSSVDWVPLFIHAELACFLYLRLGLHNEGYQSLEDAGTYGCD